MADEQLKQLVVQGLAALKSGSQVAAGATDEIENDASDEGLKAALRQGNDVSKQWSERIDRALQEAGEAQSQDNPILQAHYEVSKRIRGEAQDAQSRDLGIIAAGQLALHYWIAAFGTLRTYAAKLGMTQTEQDFQKCVDEAKQADEQHTELAAKIMQTA